MACATARRVPGTGTRTGALRAGRAGGIGVPGAGGRTLRSS
ncbi:MAG: hypothetical protein Q8N90_03300 [bacterium]|nr:hypothetical protein [bacterium]